MDSNLTFSNVWRTDGKRLRRSGSVLTDKAGSVRISEEQWGSVNGDYNCQLNSSHSEKWVDEKLIRHIPEKSANGFDDAPQHWAHDDTPPSTSQWRQTSFRGFEDRGRGFLFKTVPANYPMPVYVQ